MYSTIGSVSYISGNQGKYDEIVKNTSVRYARNSQNSAKEYIQNYSQNKPQTAQEALEADLKRTPVNFVQQYMPQKGKIDSLAVVSAAYEEMGALEVPTKDLFKDLNKLSPEFSSLTADSLDIDKNGKIDLAEYGASIILEDALSTGAKATKYSFAEKISRWASIHLFKNYEQKLAQKADGTLSNYGENRLLAYAAPQNKEIAYKTYSYLYDYYNLGEAQKEFLSDKNNAA